MWSFATGLKPATLSSTTHVTDVRFMYLGEATAPGFRLRFAKTRGWRSARGGEGPQEKRTFNCCLLAADADTNWTRRSPLSLLLSLSLYVFAHLTALLPKRESPRNYRVMLPNYRTNAQIHTHTHTWSHTRLIVTRVLGWRFATRFACFVGRVRWIGGRSELGIGQSCTEVRCGNLGGFIKTCTQNVLSVRTRSLN